MQLALVLSLAGHADWVRSIDLLERNSALYLASGSQDRYIRIWKVFQGKEDPHDEIDEENAHMELDDSKLSDGEDEESSDDLEEG